MFHFLLASSLSILTSNSSVNTKQLLISQAVPGRAAIPTSVINGIVPPRSTNSESNDFFSRNMYFLPKQNQQTEPLLKINVPTGLQRVGGQPFHECPAGTHAVAQPLSELPGEVREATGMQKNPDGSISLVYNGGGCSK